MTDIRRKRNYQNSHDYTGNNLFDIKYTDLIPNIFDSLPCINSQHWNFSRQNRKYQGVHNRNPNQI
jgi:hypothetical protein